MTKNEQDSAEADPGIAQDVVKVLDQKEVHSLDYMHII